MDLLYDSVYNFIIRCYGASIFVLSCFHPKAKLWIKGRQAWIAILARKRGGGRWIWLHASSLGEFEDFVLLFGELKKLHTSHKFLLTFHSPSGFEVVKDSGICDLIMYLPLDTPNNARHFLDILQPDAIYFSRSDLWHNYLKEIAKRKIPAYLIALFLDHESNFLKWPGRRIFRQCFHAFTHVFCQSEGTRALLEKNFGYLRSSVVGNSRVDRIVAESIQPPRFPEIERFIHNDFCIVAGSVRPEDEKIIFEAMGSLSKVPIKWLVVPHQIEESYFVKLASKHPNQIALFSNLNGSLSSQNIVVVDCVGILKYLYQYADFAIIGGGLRRVGIHNIVEPSVYGVPTSYGPNIRNYPEAEALLKMGSSRIFRNSSELVKNILAHLDREKNADLKDQTRQFINRSAGSTKRMFEYLRQAT